MDLGTRTLPGPGAAAQTLNDRRGTGTYCPLLRPALSGWPGLSARGASWEDEAVGGSMGRLPPTPATCARLSPEPRTHPGLERHELEDHLQREDDGEGHVEDVGDVVHLLRLVVVLWGAQGGAGQLPQNPAFFPSPCPMGACSGHVQNPTSLMAMPSPWKDGEGRRGGPSPSPVSRLPTHICSGRPEGRLCGQLPGAAWVQDQEANPLVLGWDDHHHPWVAPGPGALLCDSIDSRA